MRTDRSPHHGKHRQREHRSPQQARCPLCAADRPNGHQRARQRRNRAQRCKGTVQPQDEDRRGRRSRSKHTELTTFHRSHGDTITAQRTAASSTSVRPRLKHLKVHPSEALPAVPSPKCSPPPLSALLGVLDPAKLLRSGRHLPLFSTLTARTASALIVVAAPVSVSIAWVRRGAHEHGLGAESSAAAFGLGANYALTWYQSRGLLLLALCGERTDTSTTVTLGSPVQSGCQLSLPAPTTATAATLLRRSRRPSRCSCPCDGSAGRHTNLSSRQSPAGTLAETWGGMHRGRTTALDRRG